MFVCFGSFPSVSWEAEEGELASIVGGGVPCAEVQLAFLIDHGLQGERKADLRRTLRSTLRLLTIFYCYILYIDISVSN